MTSLGPLPENAALALGAARLAPSGMCAPRQREQKKETENHVRKSSITHWLSWQGRRSQNHPQQRILHGAFARDQAELEGPRDRGMEVRNDLAPDHRYMELMMLV